MRKVAHKRGTYLMNKLGSYLYWIIVYPLLCIVSATQLAWIGLVGTGWQYNMGQTDEGFKYYLRGYYYVRHLPWFRGREYAKRTSGAML
jgi:hypothetical protein